MKKKYNKVKNLIGFIVFSLIALNIGACNEVNYEYKITGTVNTKDGERPAIWYTDTFQVDSCLVITILNSNGSKHMIQPPYTIYKLKH